MTIATDLTHPSVFALLDDDLRSATAQMLEAGLRELPVLDDKGDIGTFAPSAVSPRATTSVAPPNSMPSMKIAFTRTPRS